MKVVLDTNLLLVIYPKWSADHDIFISLLNGDFEVFLTADILFEYEEVISRKNGPESASSALEIFTSLPNVHFVINHFYWGLITADYDDNKFVDCAITSGCDFLVSDDKHFKALQQIDFPKVNVIGKAEFRRKLGLPE